MVLAFLVGDITPASVLLFLVIVATLLAVAVGIAVCIAQLFNWLISDIRARMSDDYKDNANGLALLILCFLPIGILCWLAFRPPPRH